MSFMEKEEIIAIAGKIADGTASVDEISKYLSVYDKLQAEYRDWDMLDPIEKELQKDAVWKDIHATIYAKKRIRTIRLWQKIAVAALLVLSVSASLVLFLAKEQPRINGVLASNDIYPGSNKALLTLADGKVIALDKAKNGVVVSGDLLTYNDGTQVEFNTSINKDKAGRSFKKQMLMASTPRGGIYNITLSDGTRIWLNAGSTLKFPSNFDTETKRLVELSGEAYFEVAKVTVKEKGTKIPFIVSSRGQEVEVLGTHFNVNAYKDEPATKTTLLEGSVRVLNLSSNVAERLIPGQQSVLSSNSIKIKNADIDMETAWKNGEFLFKGENLQEVMRSIARWYDVEVIYESLPKDVHFGGMVSRSKNLSAVLNMLESTGEVKFKVEGRRVTVIK